LHSTSLAIDANAVGIGQPYPWVLGAFGETMRISVLLRLLCLTVFVLSAGVRLVEARLRPDRRVEIPRFTPTWSVPINWNAMTKTDISNHDKLRNALLQLHKTLLDAQRVRYERVNGRIESRGELLDLVLRDADFEWLRVLSALIARLDELVAADDKDAGAELRGVIDRLRKLVRFEGNSGFTDPYREIIEAVPDALVAHVQLSRLLADFGAAGRAG
jgi:hypothetical protein